MSKYLHGTFTSPTDLLNQLDVFLTGTAGWTQLMAPTLVTGIGYRAHYSRNIVKNGETTTVYWHLMAMTVSNKLANYWVTNTGIVAYASTGYNSVDAFQLQPGAGARGNGYAFLYGMPFDISYSPAVPFSFFTNDSGDIFVTAQQKPTETSNARYFLSVGVLNKQGYGTYVGGMYYGGSVNISWSDRINTYNNYYNYRRHLHIGGGCDTSYGRYVSTILVNVTADGVNRWYGIGNADASYDSTVQPGFSTHGNVGMSNVLYNNNNAYVSSYDSNSSSRLPRVSYSMPWLTDATGKISSTAIELSIFRWDNSVNRWSPIGTLPIVRFCPIVTENGLPFGLTVQQGNKSYFCDGHVIFEQNP
jgi:hypothetical protein